MSEEENSTDNIEELSDEDILKTITSPILDDEKTQKDLNEEIINYEDKINYDIGYYWWKKYFYSAFWNNISTPINLAITIITALTTGQSASQNLLDESINTKLGITVLMLSIFNTFFKPHQQMTINQNITKRWGKLGTKFDKLVYNKVYNNKERTIKLKRLQLLFDKVNLIKRENDSNYLIDLIFLIVQYTCLKHYLYWKPKNKLTHSSNKNNTSNNTNNNSTNIAETIV